MKRNRYYTSQFVCPECESVIPLPRQASRKRNKGHIKDIWCPFCKKVVKSKEVRKGDVFVTMDHRIIY